MRLVDRSHSAGDICNNYSFIHLQRPGTRYCQPGYGQTRVELYDDSKATSGSIQCKPFVSTSSFDVHYISGWINARMSNSHYLASWSVVTQ